MLSVVVVSAFESVGAILVIAMLILPGATASLLSQRLPRLMPQRGARRPQLVARNSSRSLAGVLRGRGDGGDGTRLFTSLAWFFAPPAGIARRAVSRRA